MKITKAEFEKRVQRAQKAIAAIAKNVEPQMVNPDMIKKVARFLTIQVDDLQRDLFALSQSGVKRGVFSLDAPVEEGLTAEKALGLFSRSTASPTVPERNDLQPVTSKDPTEIPKAKASDIVGKIAPPEVVREVMKNAEEAPERVRVFGAKKIVPPAESEVDFQEE